MTDNSFERCPHFQILTMPLEAHDPAALLLVRHCTLANRLCRRLGDEPAGRRISGLITTSGASGPLAISGPDFGPVTHDTCSIERCRQSCTPAYERLLAAFGMDVEVDLDVVCEDAAPDPVEARKE